MKTILKLLLLVAVVTTTTSTAFAVSKSTNRDWVDASTLTVINKAIDDGKPLNRLDISQFNIPKHARLYLTQSTGIAILFRTNSRSIGAVWTTTVKGQGVNYTPLFRNGLDLYIREKGEWVFAGVGKPSTKNTEHRSALVKNMEEGMKECMLYLPMHNVVTSLNITVDKGAIVEPMPSPFKHKVMFVGSSITHGFSAARPGASYVARFGRELNVETPNIGLSGKCKLDDFFADIVCAAKADAFVFDAFSNSTDEHIKERLRNFVKRITTAHPNTPMIFLQTIKRDNANFDSAARKRNDAQRTVAEKMMTEICSKYKNVYFINPGIYAGDDHEGTIDGVHLNDLGVQRTLDNIVPKIKKILKKYKIK